MPIENDGTDPFGSIIFSFIPINELQIGEGKMKTERLDAEKLYRHLLKFLNSAKDDARITPVHISLYTALVCFCQYRECMHPFSVFSAELMPFCKVSGTATYHRCIRELDEYGYIRYIPSYNHFRGSLVYLVKDDAYRSNS